MPGYAYGIPASECITGGKLREVNGSVCASCYACKGRYRFDNVQNAQYRRFNSLCHTLWVDAIVASVQGLGIEFFRWHDSGDLQGAWHLKNIVEVAKLCPKTKFWLPTKEKAIVLRYLTDHGAFPKNLVVRVSAAMINGTIDTKGMGFLASSVVTDKEKATCRAFENGGVCGACRKCWDPKVKDVSYPLH